MKSAPIPRRIAGQLADSPVFTRARRVWERNQTDYQLGLSRCEKLAVGAYLVLKDYSTGTFPPVHTDREQTFAWEKDLYSAKPGLALADGLYEARKTPFWIDAKAISSFESYVRVFRILLRCGLKSGDRVLELRLRLGVDERVLGGFWMSKRRNFDQPRRGRDGPPPHRSLRPPRARRRTRLRRDRDGNRRRALLRSRSL